MLLHQIISSKNQRKESENSQSDLIVNKIIKAIEKHPQEPESSITAKNNFFDLFNEKQEDTDKSIRACKLLDKIFKKKGSSKSNYASSQGLKPKKHQIKYEIIAQEENENKMLKIPKKEVKKPRPISDEYLKIMAEYSDLSNLFAMRDSEREILCKVLTNGPSLKKKKMEELGKKNEHIEKEEQLILKKMIPLEGMKKEKKDQKYDPTKSDQKTIKKPIENNLNNKKIVNNDHNINNKTNKNINYNINKNSNNHNNRNNSNNNNNPNNKNNNNIQKNNSNIMKINTNIIKNSKNIIKNSNNNNDKAVNRPATKPSNKPSRNTYDPFNPQKKPVITNKQYNPLEPANQNKQMNLKRNHREIYSEEDEDENLDGFIDDDESEPVNMDYRSEIRKIMRYDPKKYADDDYDDDAMEVGFNEIEREENVASLIAKKEDDIEWKYILKEKMKEEMRKKKK